MAVQIESRVLLAEYVEVFGRRRWQLILPALLVLTFGTALAVVIPKKYLVTTTIEVRPVGANQPGKETDNAPNQIRALERIRRLLERLKNPEYLALRSTEQFEFVKDVQSNVKVRVEKPPGATSSTLVIDYADVDVDRAVEFVKALREDWKKDVVDADKNKVEDEAGRLNEAVAQIDIARQQEDDAITRLCQRNKISAEQIIPGGTERRAEDPDFARLQSAKDKLAEVQLDLGRAELRVGNLEQLLGDTPEKLSEEQLREGVSHSSEILEIESKIVDLNADLARYRPQHSKYGPILARIGELEKKRENIRRMTTRGEQTSVTVTNPRYLDLQHQLEAARLERNVLADTQKKLQLSIEEDTQNLEARYLVYNEIRWRSANRSRLDEQLTALSLKRDEKALQAQALKSRLNDPFSILSEPTKPENPTEPNPWLIVGFSLVAGLGLGLAIALAGEYGRNCFRSVHDIGRVMVAPVLGSIGNILTQRQRRVRSVRRMVVGTCSAIVICAVAFVTWAWARNPDLLSAQLRARIEQVRDKLR